MLALNLSTTCPPLAGAQSDRLCVGRSHLFFKNTKDMNDTNIINVLRVQSPLSRWKLVMKKKNG